MQGCSNGVPLSGALLRWQVILADPLACNTCIRIAYNSCIHIAYNTCICMLCSLHGMPTMSSLHGGDLYIQHTTLAYVCSAAYMECPQCHHCVVVTLHQGCLTLFMLLCLGVQQTACGQSSKWWCSKTHAVTSKRSKKAFMEAWNGHVGTLKQGLVSNWAFP